MAKRTVVEEYRLKTGNKAKEAGDERKRIIAEFSKKLDDMKNYEGIDTDRKAKGIGEG